MNSSEFVQQLKSLTPAKEKLLGLGYEEEDFQDLLNSYNLKKVKEDTVTTDSLLDLIYKYDVSSFDIGMIRFNQPEDVLDTDKYIVFGVADAFTMAIDKITNEVVELDWADTDYVIVRCSKDTDSFLEALLLVEEFDLQKLFNEDLAEDQPAIMAKAKEIAEVAGGDKYLNFYLESLGYEGE